MKAQNMTDMKSTTENETDMINRMTPEDLTRMIHPELPHEKIERIHQSHHCLVDFNTMMRLNEHSLRVKLPPEYDEQLLPKINKTLEYHKDEETLDALKTSNKILRKCCKSYMRAIRVPFSNKTRYPIVLLFSHLLVEQKMYFLFRVPFIMSSKPNDYAEYLLAVRFDEFKNLEPVIDENKNTIRTTEYVKSPRIPVSANTALAMTPSANSLTI
jgi:hypothetical protein